MLPETDELAPTLKHDPPQRSDRRCSGPGCDNKLVTVTSRMRRYAGAQIEADPFCSTACCKRWHEEQAKQEVVKVAFRSFLDGVPVEELAESVWEQAGHESPSACAESLRHEFMALKELAA